MRSRPSSRRGASALRKAAGVVLLLALSAASWLLVRGATPRHPTTSTAYSQPAHLAHFEPSVLTTTVSQLRLVVNDDQRVHHALALATHHRAPFLAATASGRHDPLTLVLVARARPYGLDSVMSRVPSAFSRTAAGAVLLRFPMLVAPGATLVVDSRTVPALMLLSDPAGYASITAVSATLDLRGHPGRPLVVSSFDPATDGPDTAESDGRAYLQDRGGTMTVRATKLSYLGYAIGRSSGVAWLGEGTRPATGGAAWSTFSHNYVGASTFAAQGLVVTHAAFLDNDVYGVDSHAGTTSSVIADSVAARNGRHGFILSRGCHENLLRNDEAYDNGITGFVIDDGHVALDGNPRHAVPVPSDHNRLLDVSSHDNGFVGITIEGGTGNSVESSTLDNNRYGLWVKNAAADTLVTGDTITRSLRAGVRLFDQTRTTDITHTTISGGADGITVGRGVTLIATDVRVVHAERTALQLRGTHPDDAITRVTVSGSGPRAVDSRDSPLSPAQRAAIDDSGWRVTHRPMTPVRYVTTHVNLLAWVPIVVLPPVFWLPARRRRRLTASVRIRGGSA